MENLKGIDKNLIDLQTDLLYMTFTKEKHICNLKKNKKRQSEKSIDSCTKIVNLMAMNDDMIDRTGCGGW